MDMALSDCQINETVVRVLYQCRDRFIKGTFGWLATQPYFYLFEFWNSPIWKQFCTMGQKINPRGQASDYHGTIKKDSHGLDPLSCNPGAVTSLLESAKLMLSKYQLKFQRPGSSPKVSICKMSLPVCSFTESTTCASRNMTVWMFCHSSTNLIAWNYRSTSYSP